MVNNLSLARQGQHPHLFAVFLRVLSVLSERSEAGGSICCRSKKSLNREDAKDAKVSLRKNSWLPSGQKRHLTVFFVFCSSWPARANTPRPSLCPLCLCGETFFHHPFARAHSRHRAHRELPTVIFLGPHRRGQPPNPLAVLLGVLGVLSAAGGSIGCRSKKSLNREDAKDAKVTLRKTGCFPAGKKDTPWRFFNASTDEPFVGCRSSSTSHSS